MSSAIRFKLDQFKSLSSGNGLSKRMYILPKSRSIPAHPTTPKKDIVKVPIAPN